MQPRQRKDAGLRWKMASAAGLFGLCLAAPLTPAMAASGNPDAGAAIAQAWCANCHLVSPDQAIARTEAPSFQTLADQPDRTIEGLEAFLFDPHPPMPDLDLSRQQIDDVIAYILSLSKTRTSE